LFCTEKGMFCSLRGVGLFRIEMMFCI